MKYKKLYAVLLIVLILFTSCDNKEIINDIIITKQKNTMDKKSNVTLIWYQAGTEPDFKESKTVKKYLNTQTQKILNTQIEYLYATTEQAKTIIATNEYFDIITVKNMQNEFIQYANDLLFAPLQKHLKEDFNSLYTFIPTPFWEAVTVNNNIYAIPNYSISLNQKSYILNSELLEKSKVTYQDLTKLNQNLDTLTPILEKVQMHLDTPEYKKTLETQSKSKTDNNINKMTNAFMLDKNGYIDDICDFVTYNGGGIGLPYDSTDNKLKHLIEQEAFIKNQKIISKWQELGYINKNASKVSDIIYSPIAINNPYLYYDTTINKSTYDFNVIPKDPIILTNHSALEIYTAVSSASNHIERSVEFVEFLNLNEEYRNSLAYGIEDIHYIKDAKNEIIRTYLGDKYTPNVISQASVFNLYTLPYPKYISFEKIKSNIDNAQRSKLLGFYPDLSLLYTQFDEIDKVFNKYKTNLFLGKVDIEATVLKVMKELNEAGLSFIKQKLQTQLDTYLLSKKNHIN